VENRIAKWPNVTDVSTAREYVKATKEAGARYALGRFLIFTCTDTPHPSFIKLMQEDGHAIDMPFPVRPIPMPSLEVQKAIVQEAHRHGLLTVAHALCKHTVLAVLKAGVDGLAHCPIDPVSSEIVQAVQESGAFLIPTLVVSASCSGEEQETREKFAKGLVGPEKEHLQRCLHISRDGFSMKNACDTVRALKEAGVDILW